VSVIADAYLAGVSTRRLDKLLQQLRVERMSKSQVSRLAKSLDGIVEDFRTRPLNGAAVAVDAHRVDDADVDRPAALPALDVLGKLRPPACYEQLQHA
jgi:hypothetical protein